MGLWKISGIVTDETPSKNDGMVTLIEGMTWPKEVPLRLFIEGPLIGRIRLSKGTHEGHPVVLGEGVMLDFAYDLVSVVPFGFGMCGLIDKTITRHDNDSPVTIATDVRVTYVAVQELHKCFSPDYVVKLERMEDESPDEASDLAATLAVARTA